MCFIIDPKYPEKKIAKRDITCYKNLNSDMTSPFQGMQYKLGVLYKQPIGAIIYDDVIREGFHSYSNKRKAIRMPDRDWSLYKCIIPKGSEYYYDSGYREYVSNQIIIKEKI